MQKSISQRNDPDWIDSYTEKLYFAENQGLYHVELFGSPHDESYGEFLRAICERAVADQLRSLVLRGPDEGANGTRNWDLTQLLESNVEFPAINSLFVEPTAPEHYDHSIIGSFFAAGAKRDWGGVGHTP